jgi:hypothetical protein
MTLRWGFASETGEYIYCSSLFHMGQSCEEFGQAPFHNLELVVKSVAPKPWQIAEIKQIMKINELQKYTETIKGLDRVLDNEGVYYTDTLEGENRLDPDADIFVKLNDVLMIMKEASK